jgi:hypothetical protein
VRKRGTDSKINSRCYSTLKIGKGYREKLNKERSRELMLF